MRHLEGWARTCVVAALGLWLSGCEPAGRPKRQPPRGELAASPRKAEPSESRPTKPSEPPNPPPLDPGLTWRPADVTRMQPQVRIEFVHADVDPKQWNELKDFWTEVPAPHAPAASVGLPPLQAAVLALAPPATQMVKIKVPLGLDDPTPHIPLVNPPTVGKWELGKQLFFDDGWLKEEAAGKESCATCHIPEQGFSSRRISSYDPMMAVPTLINTVYNTHQFWDGRAGALEEVVQRSLQDERPEAASADRHHVWSGVVRRLRDDPNYTERFRQVFGTDPTQDAVGKALATYMRTILCGDSIFDRAMQSMRQRKGSDLEPADFEKFLDDATLKSWDRDPAMKAEAAKELHMGYQLFFGKANCFKCHLGANFTDNSFHNLGIGDSGLTFLPGKETGRFAVLPIGLKNPAMIGAYKTPTLRGLRHKDRYFHNGQENNLFKVVALHVRVGIWNPNLDPEMRDPMDPNKPRDLGLKEPEVVALVQFLLALEGQPVAEVVRAAPKPETPAPSQP